MHRLTNGMDNDIQELIESTTERYIPEVDVGGARIMKQEVFPESDGFRAYIMVYVDRNSAAIQQSIKQAMDKSHEELMQHNADYRTYMQKSAEQHDQ